MIRIRDIVLTPEQDESQLLYMAAAVLKIPASQIASLRIHKKSIDARKKPEIRILYTLDAALHSGERQVLRRCRRAEKAEEDYYKPPKATVVPETRPIVVGFGPAGIFAALVLAEAGLRPLSERSAPPSARWSGASLRGRRNTRMRRLRSQL